MDKLLKLVVIAGGSNNTRKQVCTHAEGIRPHRSLWTTRMKCDDQE